MCPQGLSFDTGPTPPSTLTASIPRARRAERVLLQSEVKRRTPPNANQIKSGIAHPAALVMRWIGKVVHPTGPKADWKAKGHVGLGTHSPPCAFESEARQPCSLKNIMPFPQELYLDVIVSPCYVTAFGNHLGTFEDGRHP